MSFLNNGSIYHEMNPDSHILFPLYQVFQFLPSINTLLFPICRELIGNILEIPKKNCSKFLFFKICADVFPDFCKKKACGYIFTELSTICENH